jgi:2-(1,2-epoxy-1,2-dihydrophenyl)acetyl-CoA isomerase
MSAKYIIEDRQDKVSLITLNRPDKLNAFNNDMVLETRDAILGADADPDVRAIVITGAGNMFSAGGDMAEFKAFREESKRKGYQVSPIDQHMLERFALSMGQLSKPIIAAINGAAVGLGLTIPLACDIRIASEKAKLGAVFLRVGLNPEFGSTFNLTRIVGFAKASELLFTAKMVDAQEALAIGLVNQVAPHEELLPAAMEMARVIASMPPMGVKLAKASLRNGVDNNLASQVRQESTAINVMRDTKDYEEGINAFFEKREPVFTGR